MAREGDAGITQKAGVLDRGGANDDVGQAAVEAGCDSIEVADATAELNRNFVPDFGQDSLDRCRILRLAGKGAVQVDQMQATGALIQPMAGLGSRTIGKDSGLLHQALLQTDTLAVLEVNRRNNQHRDLGE